MNKAHVSLILDESGSMSSVREKTISGVNEYFTTLKNDKETEYTVDLVLFAEQSKKVHSGSLQGMAPLTAETYNPNNGTALYDAVCETLMAREGAGGKWIVVIMTDGEENASKKYTEQQFAEYVKLLKATGNVQFVFLGANQDSFAKAQKWNFDRGNVANFVATSAGVGKAMNMMAMNTRASVSMDWSVQGNSNYFTQADQNDLEQTK